MRSFETWTYEQVEDVFGITAIDNSLLFTQWLTADNTELTPIETTTLEHYRKLLFREVKNWNEDELKLFFIGPILGLVDFNTPYYKPFTQRTLTIEKGSVSASGKIDFMLAKGKMIPKKPYFCLHEYKQENRRDNDPLGQLLIAMVSAQNKNENDVLPIYGCYVSGRNWFFVLLEGLQYSLSDAYVATSEDILKIFAILKKCKSLVDVSAKAK